MIVEFQDNTMAIGAQDRRERWCRKYPPRKSIGHLIQCFGDISSEMKEPLFKWGEIYMIFKSESYPSTQVDDKY